nr:MAG TPA: hypothetical protein [Caudoviricetes sp.]
MSTISFRSRTTESVSINTTRSLGIPVLASRNSFNLRSIHLIAC